jgi:hypothetical protein
VKNEWATVIPAFAGMTDKSPPLGEVLPAFFLDFTRLTQVHLQVKEAEWT